MSALFNLHSTLNIYDQHKQELFRFIVSRVGDPDDAEDVLSETFIAMLEDCGITISRSRPGSPWENGYQESFYDKFKIDFGDPNRFTTLGELVAEIYGTLWQYNHTRIHSVLKMPPAAFAEQLAA